MQRVLVLNGPNLNLLGARRPDVYGSTTLTQLEEITRGWGAELGLEVACAQSNHEGEVIDLLHDARGSADGVVINPGAYTHTSYALHDAIEAIELPTVEVHLSNVWERETWRRRSVVRPACVHTIYGRGVAGYRWALRHLVYRELGSPAVEHYGPMPDHVMDVRIPSGAGPHPAAVLLHGGFWRHMWTRDTMDALAVDLWRRGFVTANVEYHRVGKGGGGRVTVRDVTMALKTVATKTEVDPDRMVVVGHSAGGHLALITGNVVDNALVVSLAGVTDLVRAGADGLGEGATEAYIAGAPLERLSPIHRLPVGNTQLLAHAPDDDRVPYAYSADYVDAATAAGDTARLVEVTGGHFGFLDPDSPAWTVVAEAIDTPQ